MSDTPKPIELWTSDQALVWAYPAWQLPEIMRARCESQGHEWENCCSLLFQVYQECKWCGERR